MPRARLSIRSNAGTIPASTSRARRLAVSATCQQAAQQAHETSGISVPMPTTRAARVSSVSPAR
eukprot:scaffold303290_cov28-Prasinocladus_malaysianus.AAC.1